MKLFEDILLFSRKNDKDLSLEGFIYFISASLHILNKRHHIDRCYKLHGNHFRVFRL